MFSHSSHFKKLIALYTAVALFSMTLTPLTPVFAEEEESTPPLPMLTEGEVGTPTPLPADVGAETPAPETPAEVSPPPTLPSPVEVESTDTENPTDEIASSTEPLTITASTTQDAVVENAATSTSDTGDNVALLDETASSTATTTQDAVVENAATSTSDTGDNIALLDETASSTATTTAPVVVETGDAVAVANVITAVNVSVYNSSGLLLFLTNLLGGVGTIDFRSLGFLAPPPQTPVASSTPCSFVGCDSGLLTNLTTTQNATVNNSVSVGANTGGNTATGGDASISTGNAAAAANVVTVANSTFIDSNYLMVVFNQFGSWGNDVVFPGAEAFGSLFGGSSTQGSGSVAINTNNNATVTNEVSVTADTGNNTASSTDGSATVVTGDATAGATVVNTVTTSLIDSNAFVVIFRIHGNWSGSLFGLPPGVSWAQTPDGVALYSTPEGNSTSVGGSLFASTTQNATIHNSVEVYALTGNNKAEGGDASVNTGDATAVANVVTIANSQVVGRNWLFAIVNIFGDWSGNIAFGRPNLWVAGSIDMPQNPAQMRDTIHYTFTLKNNGDADAHDGALTVNLPASLEYVSSDTGGTHATGTVTWQLGTLTPQSTRTIGLDVGVTDRIGYGTSQITLTPRLTSQEPDQDDVDNSDEITIDAFRPGPAPVSYYRAPTITGTPIPAITITKVVRASSTVASSTVSYRVSLTNEAEGPAYQTVLFDTLRDPQGKVVFEKTWDVGDIAPHETVNVDYDVFFVGSSTPGIYTNEAYLKGLGGLPWSEPYKGVYITSRTATATLMVTAPIHLQTSATSEEGVERATSTTLGGTIHGKSLLIGPYSVNTNGGHGQLAGLGFAADSRRLLSLFPLFLALIGAAYYISRNGEIDWTERRELVLDFLRSHHLFFW